MRILQYVIGIITLCTVLLFGVLIWIATAEQPEEMQSDTSVTVINKDKPWILSKLSLLPPFNNTKKLVGIIVENQEYARPYHAGLDDAVLIEEFIVEGGISRFIALFDVNNVPEKVGPIRSLRPYFIDGALPYTSVIFHAGGSPEAFAQARALSGSVAINLLRYDDGVMTIRDKEAFAPHNLFIAPESLNTLILDNDGILRSESWPLFSIGKSSSETEEANVIDIDFLSTLHNVTFTYDTDNDAYVRVNGGIESAATPSDIIILQAPITAVGEYGRLTIPLDRGGDGLLFRNGTMQSITWEKESSEERFILKDADGNVANLEKGPIWIMVLPTLDRVTWTSEESAE